MLFKPEMCQAILEGRKTQTRRLVQEGEFAVNQHGRVIPDPVWGNKIHTVYDRNGRIKWQLGRTYAIQPGRGKNAAGRFLLLAIRREGLLQIRGRDAEAEGCRVPIRHFIWGRTARQPFFKLWDSIHTKGGTRAKDNPGVWVHEFELVSTPKEASKPI